MAGLRVATWNVNSIRTRVDRVVDWLQRSDVDVLAMQETKCADDKFPTMPFAAAGYEVAHCGYDQWNGVAIASRVGIDDVAAGFPGQPAWGKDGVAAKTEARALGATCAGVRVWSLYVPNGRGIDDPHYRYKLQWLAALRDCSDSWIQRQPEAQLPRLSKVIGALIAQMTQRLEQQATIDLRLSKHSARHHDVVTSVAGDQLGVQGFVVFKGLVVNLDASFLCEIGHHVLGDVVRPVIDVEDFFLGVDGYCSGGRCFFFFTAGGKSQCRQSERPQVLVHDVRCP